MKFTLFIFLFLLVLLLPSLVYADCYIGSENGYDYVCRGSMSTFKLDCGTAYVERYTNCHCTGDYSMKYEACTTNSHAGCDNGDGFQWWQGENGIQTLEYMCPPCDGMDGCGKCDASSCSDCYDTEDIDYGTYQCIQSIGGSHTCDLLESGNSFIFPSYGQACNRFRCDTRRDQYYYRGGDVCGSKNGMQMLITNIDEYVGICTTNEYADSNPACSDGKICKYEIPEPDEGQPYYAYMDGCSSKCIQNISYCDKDIWYPGGPPPYNTGDKYTYPKFNVEGHCAPDGACNNYPQSDVYLFEKVLSDRSKLICNVTISDEEIETGEDTTFTAKMRIKYKDFSETEYSHTLFSGDVPCEIQGTEAICVKEIDLCYVRGLDLSYKNYICNATPNDGHEDGQSSYDLYTLYNYSCGCLEYDFDGDGWVILIDCDDNNASIHPLAPELCNNIDDDCDELIDEDLTESCGSGDCIGTQVCLFGVWSDCDSYGNDAGTCAICNQDGTPVYDDTQDADCDDGVYCNGEETCSAVYTCNEGVSIDCSANNIDPIETCFNSPDDNPLTYDYFEGFTSTCDEDSDICTTETFDLTHTCCISNCDAECESDEDCDDSNPETIESCNECICEYLDLGIDLHNKWNLFTATIPPTDGNTDKNISLLKGWNLFGYSSDQPFYWLDADISNPTETKTITEAQSAGWLQATIYYYDPTEGYYKLVPGDYDYLEANKAYWLYAFEDDLTLTLPNAGGSLNGNSYYWMNAQLNNGTETKTITEAQSGGWLQATIYYYDPISGYYKFVPGNDDHIQPWKGYWLYSKNGNLSLILT